MDETLTNLRILPESTTNVSLVVIERYPSHISACRTD